ncbi:MAG: hypothetical protein ACYS1A_05450 [Planctomycetota bacterium]|jgi:hypothetical protein
MNSFLIYKILVASNNYGEDTFWIQILVFLLVAASLGVYSLVKRKPGQARQSGRGIATKIGSGHIESSRRFQLSHKHITPLKSVVQKYTTKVKDIRFRIRKPLKGSTLDLDTAETAGQRNADLTGGMELLELDFLLRVAENTEGKNKNDVMMRKLTFNELVRRIKLDQVNSSVLKVYAINQEKLHGKDIQCEAIKELSKRTTYKSKNKPSKT